MTAIERQYEIVPLPGQVQVRLDDQIIYAAGVPRDRPLDSPEVRRIGLEFITRDLHRFVLQVFQHGNSFSVTTGMPPEK